MVRGVSMARFNRKNRITKAKTARRSLFDATDHPTSNHIAAAAPRRKQKVRSSLMVGTAFGSGLMMLTLAAPQPADAQTFQFCTVSNGAPSNTTLATGCAPVFDPTLAVFSDSTANFSLI